MRNFITRLTAFLTLGLALVACSVHKIDIQQGNVITQEMLETLTLGMDKRKVKVLLGAPMIQDPFHRERWDYIYSFQAGNTPETQTARIVLHFTDDKLAKIDVIKPPPKEADIKKPALSQTRN